MLNVSSEHSFKGKAGWTAVTESLKQPYEKDDNTTAFETWREFKIFCGKDGQTVDDYIMCYEKYKFKIKQFKMDLGEHIHELNLLCGANLSNAGLHIAMREVNT